MQQGEDVARKQGARGWSPETLPFPWGRVQGTSQPVSSGKWPESYEPHPALLLTPRNPQHGNHWRLLAVRSAERIGVVKWGSEGMGGEYLRITHVDSPLEEISGGLKEKGVGWEMVRNEDVLDLFVTRPRKQCEKTKTKTPKTLCAYHLDGTITITLLHFFILFLTFSEAP